MIILRQKEFSGHSISWQQGLDATGPGIIVDNGKKLDPEGNREDEYLSNSFHDSLKLISSIGHFTSLYNLADQIDVIPRAKKQNFRF